MGKACEDHLGYATKLTARTMNRSECCLGVTCVGLIYFRSTLRHSSAGHAHACMQLITKGPKVTYTDLQTVKQLSITIHVGLVGSW